MYNNIRGRKQKRISLLQVSPYGHIIQYTIRLSRQFWGVRSMRFSFGIITDGDKGCIYSDLINRMENFLRDPRRTHHIKPYLTLFKRDKKITLSFKKRDEIPMWTMQIPNSLEIQIANMFKRKYPELRRISSEDDTIREVMAKFSKTKEEVIQMSVALFKGERWFIRFCNKLRKNIEWSS